MREMCVIRRFFDKKSFGCFDPDRAALVVENDDIMPVVVLTKEEWEKITEGREIIYEGHLVEEKEGE